MYPILVYPILWRHFKAKLQALLADAEEYGATLALRTQLRGGQVYQEGWSPQGPGARRISGRKSW